jgi:hypothetical protein
MLPRIGIEFASPAQRRATADFIDRTNVARVNAIAREVMLATLVTWVNEAIVTAPDNETWAQWLSADWETYPALAAAMLRWAEIEEWSVKVGMEGAALLEQWES